MPLPSSFWSVLGYAIASSPAPEKMLEKETAVCEELRGCSCVWGRSPAAATGDPPRALTCSRTEGVKKGEAQRPKPSVLGVSTQTLGGLWGQSWWVNLLGVGC